VAKKLSELDLVILAILRDEGALHGFDVGEKLEERLGREVGPGSYYRVLHRLERDDYLTAFWESEEDAATHRGPRRRYYELSGSREDVNRAIEVYEREARRILAALRPREA
jgi:DNA-binding PadR family transcriptional regulator